MSIMASSDYDSDRIDMNCEKAQTLLDNIMKVMRLPNPALFQIMMKMDEDDSLASMISDFTAKDKFEKKVNEKLGKAINSIWQEKLIKENLKDRLDKHYRPENCDSLVVPTKGKRILNYKKFKPLT